ncbi:hypothetical protein TNCV_1254741, partial [Trichonephila clavipes]
MVWMKRLADCQAVVYNWKAGSVPGKCEEVKV